MEENKKTYIKARTKIALKEWVIEKREKAECFFSHQRRFCKPKDDGDVAAVSAVRTNAHFSTFCHEGSKSVRCHTCALLIMSTNSVLSTNHGGGC